jgi:nitronate monooxygenase
MTGTLTLISLIKPHVGSTPLIAAGGIMTGQQVLAALAAGAAGVQLGTAFLAADEAGTSQTGREMLQQPDRGTLVTQVGLLLPTRPSMLLSMVDSCCAGSRQCLDWLQ